MSQLSELRERIELERETLEKMFRTVGMTEVLEQSQKLDRLIEEYLVLTE